MVVDREQFISCALDEYWAEKSTNQAAELEREWACK